MELIQPEKAGFSSARLERINQLTQGYVDRKQLAGFVTLVARNGKVVHFSKAGIQDETGRPMALDTIFRIYSMTKPITSAAVMMLMEEGKYLLDDPISKFIPEFKNMKVYTPTRGSDFQLVPANREVTIQDLLTHTGGLAYGFDREPYVEALYFKHIWGPMWRGQPMTLEKIVKEVAKLPLSSQPGTAYRYSISIDVLGYLVQVVSGMSFADFLAERIFKPLGMVDTAFYVPAEKVDRFAAMYSTSPKDGMTLNEPAGKSEYLRPDRLQMGGGGLVSTTEDYFRFAQMLLNGGALDGTRILGRKTVECMLMDHLPAGLHPFDDPSRGFGFGGGVATHPQYARALNSVGNYGWSGAAQTDFWIDPQEKLVGILMMQCMPSNVYPVDHEFRNMVYQALVD